MSKYYISKIKKSDLTEERKEVLIQWVTLNQRGSELSAILDEHKDSTPEAVRQALAQERYKYTSEASKLRMTFNEAEKRVLGLIQGNK